MKITTKTLLLTGGLAAGLGLSSCVVPDTGYASTTTETTYRPGYSVNTLPGGYRSEVIGGTDYYYHNGSYYRSRGNSYVVVDAPRRSRYYEEYTRYGNKTVHNHPDGSSHVIDELPRGYTTVQHRGTPYYRHQDRYYQRRGTGYITVASPF